MSWGMRIPLSLLLASCMVVAGCSRTGQERQPTSTEAGSTRPEETQEMQRHVYLSSTELAIELQEHCAAASDALKAAAEELSGSSKPNVNEVRRSVAEAQKKMDYCMKMVHGIGETTRGAAAEKGPSRR